MTGTGEGLTVLDKRFPIDGSSEREPFWAAMIADWWQRNPEFTADERERVAYQAGIQAAVAAHGGERRYIQPLEETSPWQLPDDWYQAGPYLPLTPAALEATAPVLDRVAAVYAEPEPPGRWWRRTRRAA